MPTGFRRPEAKVRWPRAVRVELLNARARQRLFVDIAARADRDVEALAVAAEGEVARPMSAAFAQGALGRHALGRTLGRALPRLVGEAPDRARVRDVEPSRAEDEAVQLRKAVVEHDHFLGNAVPVGVAKKGDLARRLACDEDIAIGRHRDLSRMGERGEMIDLESRQDTQRHVFVHMLELGWIGDAGRRVGLGKIGGAHVNALARGLIRRVARLAPSRIHKCERPNRTTQDGNRPQASHARRSRAHARKSRPDGRFGQDGCRGGAHTAPGPTALTNC